MWKLSGDVTGTLGLLSCSSVLCEGSLGPGFGVVRLSSLSSLFSCDVEGAEWETGEQGNGAIAAALQALRVSPKRLLGWVSIRGGQLDEVRCRA